MSKHCQVGFEFLIIISIVLVVTALVNTSMFFRSADIMLRGRSIDILRNCEDFSSSVTQTLKLNNMKTKFYTYYNLSINSSSMLISSNYEAGTVFCNLLTKNLINQTGNNIFLLSDGEYYLINTDGTIMVQSV